jgi:peptidase E
MRKILTLAIGGRLSMNLKSSHDDDVFFEIISGNNKVISYIPLFSLEGTHQLYKDITNRTLGKSVMRYLQDIFDRKQRSIQAPDKRK